MHVSAVELPVRGESFTLRVPGEFFAYRPLAEAERVATPAGPSSFIGFGVLARAVHVFVDEDSGAVLYGLNPVNTGLVNTSLRKFVDCVAGAASLYPYYSAESDWDDWERGAQRVEEAIRGIDFAAYQEGSFWCEFRWDVSMGDFHA